MRQVAFLVAAASGLVVFHLFTLTYAVTYAAITVTPTWWLGLFAAQRIAHLSWVVGSHALAVLIASLPIAVLATVAFGRVAVPAAVAIATVVFLTIEVPVLGNVLHSSTLQREVMALEVIEVLVSLPLSVWLLRLLPSNYELERTIKWRRHLRRDRAAAQGER
ncbi:MAG TPA: hypothetical protein VMI92_06780 [Steroidobacteraceae bacterium]|nr:hypothetical protein [Steroidobacteraceae bacterium]